MKTSRKLNIVDVNFKGNDGFIIVLITVLIEWRFLYDRSLENLISTQQRHNGHFSLCDDGVNDESQSLIRHGYSWRQYYGAEFYSPFHSQNTPTVWRWSTEYSLYSFARYYLSKLQHHGSLQLNKVTPSIKTQTSDDNW